MKEQSELFVNEENLLRGEELKMAQALLKQHTRPVGKVDGHLCIYDITVLPGNDPDLTVQTRQANSNYQRIKGVAVEMGVFKDSGELVCVPGYTGIYMDVQPAMDSLRERVY